MFHPSILAQYDFARHSQQMLSIDACIAVAEFNGILVPTLAQFLMSMGIDTVRLSVLV